MGYDLLWVKFPEKDYSEKGVPDEFMPRYRDRQHWLDLMWNADPDIKQTCSCDLSVDGRHSYGCSDVSALRPKDFAKFRELLKEKDMFDAEEYGGEEGEPSIFEKMTDWLEVHPDFYISFSN